VGTSQSTSIISVSLRLATSVHIDRVGHALTHQCVANMYHSWGAAQNGAAATLSASTITVMLRYRTLELKVIAFITSLGHRLPTKHLNAQIEIWPSRLEFTLNTKSISIDLSIKASLLTWLFRRYLVRSIMAFLWSFW
jgi:hypothetical protein